LAVDSNKGGWMVVVSIMYIKSGTIDVVVEEG
jgi:hypothetical protein